MEDMGPLSCDLMLEMLEFLGEIEIPADNHEGLMHRKEVQDALESFTDNSEGLAHLVTTLRVSRAYAGRKKRRFVCRRVMSTPRCRKLSNGCGPTAETVRMGRPPPTPIERAIQGVLDGIIQVK